MSGFLHMVFYFKHESFPFQWLSKQIKPDIIILLYRIQHETVCPSSWTCTCILFTVQFQNLTYCFQSVMSILSIDMTILLITMVGTIAKKYQGIRCQCTENPYKPHRTRPRPWRSHHDLNNTYIPMILLVNFFRNLGSSILSFICPLHMVWFELHWWVVCTCRQNACLTYSIICLLFLLK